MSYQIKLYHKVFEYQLPASSLLVYAGILNHANRLSYAYVKAETLAKTTGLSAKTVLRAAAQLQDRGLITISQRHGAGGWRIHNGYAVTPMAGGYTLIPSDIFRCGLSKSAFYTYLYLRKCAGNSTKAFPSLSNIAGALKITVKTIIAALAELVSRNLLGKRHCIKTNGSYGHNQYHLKNILKAIESLFPSFSPAVLPVAIGEEKRKKTRLRERVFGFVSATTQKIYEITTNILHKVAKSKPFLGIGV